MDVGFLSRVPSGTYINVSTYYIKYKVVKRVKKETLTRLFTLVLGEPEARVQGRALRARCEAPSHEVKVL